MTLKALAAALVLAALASPALAGPYLAVDGSNGILVLVDRGSINRYGAIRDAKVLYVLKGRQPVVFHTSYNCDMLTMEEIDQRLVGKDMTLGAPARGKPGTVSVAPGSLGYAGLVNICQDKVVNASGGWTRADLKGAIDAAIAAGYVPVWP